MIKMKKKFFLNQFLVRSDSKKQQVKSLVLLYKFKKCHQIILVAIVYISSPPHTILLKASFILKCN